MTQSSEDSQQVQMVPVDAIQAIRRLEFRHAATSRRTDGGAEGAG